MNTRSGVSSRPRLAASLFEVIGVIAILSQTMVASADATTTGYWRFEEGTAGTQATASASVVDSSGSGNPGTPSGGPTYSSNVPVNLVPQTGASNNLSLAFDNVDDSITFPSAFQFNTPGDATLEFWLNPSSAFATQEMDIFWTRTDNIDANRFNVDLALNDHSIFMDYRDPNGALHHLLVGPPIPSDTWTFVAVTRSGVNNYALYLNCGSTPVATGTDSNPNLPTNTGWTISGRSALAPGRLTLGGLLDEVRLSNAALSPSQFLCAPGTRPSQLDFAACPKVMATSYPAAGQGPGPVCSSPAFTPGDFFGQPGGTCIQPAQRDPIGTLPVSDNPLGLFVHVSQFSCLGPGVAGAPLTATISGPQGSIVTSATTGPFGAVLFPVGALGPGSYGITVSFAGATITDPFTHMPTTWGPTSAEGTLVVMPDGQLS